MGPGDIWNLIIGNPVLNVLIALSHILGGSFGLAIIALTIIVRLISWPLTKRQLSSTKALQDMQPKIQELQKKYGKNQQKLQQEMMKLYKEAGVNPLGCLWPMLVQFPIWIALYQAIMRALATTPENLLDLAGRLYSWGTVNQAIPLNSYFLGLDLGGQGNIVLAILVGGTMWVQQKMTQAPSVDPRQASTSRIMLLMMPIMFGLLSLSFPAGLGLYWAVSSVIGIIAQYFVTGGWGYLKLRSPSEPMPVKRK
ncbi:MAG: YidC/Oxa1 family membrane protein insertase [Dehalococcoidia bacterium]|nr:YidC/Oxa1 family membrane protein insertase [Dehalococcoidia bacterium]MDH4291614.1 YidC/Oxa1 family membrane protein insertase [Dehalococcoidia bacterium]